jgi:uncharacterized protein (UPF0548 family)
MAEWRLFRGWSSAELRTRLLRLPDTPLNFDGVEADMTADNGWHHYYSEAVIAREPDLDARFQRARVALANYTFSDPAIVTAHFDPAVPLLARRLLLEIKIFGIHYLCPAVVNKVRDEPDVYGFRYDTLAGHIERGVEWFLLTRTPAGEVRFHIEARWRRGPLPNWWSRIGFILLAGTYQRRWHRMAHRRMSLLAHYGSTRPPARDRSGLAHQGVDVKFTYYSKGHPAS